MTTKIAVLLEPTIATADGASYTSKDCVSTVDKITATNEAAAIATATAQLISPDGTKSQVIVKAIQPGAVWSFPEVVGHVIDIGGKINVVSTTPNAIRVRISGRQFT